MRREKLLILSYKADGSKTEGTYWKKTAEDGKWLVPQRKFIQMLGKGIRGENVGEIKGEPVGTNTANHMAVCQ